MGWAGEEGPPQAYDDLEDAMHVRRMSTLSTFNVHPLQPANFAFAIYRNWLAHI